MVSRSIFKKAAIIVLLVLFFGCGPKQSIFVPEKGALLDPGIVYGVLPNGFQYLLKKNTTPKERVSIHLDIFAGSLHETDEQQGLAHYLEHMLFNGSEHFKPGELIEYFQSIGMDFGGDANAHTGFFNTVYDLSLPEADEKNLDKAFLILQDYAQGALLLKEEIDRERGIILAEKRERDSVSYRTYKKSLEFELPGSLLNKRYPIGIDSVIKKADRNLLKSYYEKWYRPDNMALIMVGDFNVSKARKMIIKRFSKLKSNTLVSEEPPTFDWHEHKGLKTFYHHEPESGSTDVTIETLVREKFELQTVDKLKSDVLTGIANSMLQNRISRLVSQQNVDFLHGAVYAGSYLHHIKMSAITATCDPGKWQSTLFQIEQILRQALEYGFTNKELLRVKADTISSLEQAESLSNSRKSSLVAKQILRNLNQKKLLLSAKQRKELLQPYIESVTLNEAYQALKKVWDKNHRLVLVTGNAKIDTDNPEKNILENYKKSAYTKVLAYQDFESKNFPYLRLPDAKFGVRKKDTSAKDLGITTIEFENNIRLNLKQTDFKPNEFLFKLCFGNGKRSEPLTKPGLAAISESVLQDSGFGKLDKDQLEEALAGKKIKADFSIQDNALVFSGSAASKEIQLVFELIYHAVNDPGFRGKPLDLFKTRYKQQYESLLRTSDGIMLIKGLPFLAKEDSRFGLISPDRMNKYSISDIKTWLMSDFKRSPLEISIVGDFNYDELISVASGYLGGLKKRNKFPVIVSEGKRVNFPHGKSIELNVDTKIENSVLHVAFKTDDFWDIMQTRRLSILSRVLSERLRLVIREELGEAYSPYVYNQASRIYKGYGVMQAVIKIKPGNQQIVYDKIKKIMQSVSRNGISEKETQFALQPVLNHLRDLRKTNTYWLNSVMGNSSNYPVKYDWARNILKGYKSITHKDLEKLAKKYLKIGSSAMILIEPKNNAK